MSLICRYDEIVSKNWGYENLIDTRGSGSIEALKNRVARDRILEKLEREKSEEFFKILSTVFVGRSLSLKKTGTLWAFLNY